MDDKEEVIDKADKFIDDLEGHIASWMDEHDFYRISGVRITPDRIGIEFYPGNHPVRLTSNNSVDDKLE